MDEEVVREGLRYFRAYFNPLTGHDPFPWQEALFQAFVNRQFFSGCNIPTGLGKTSIMAIWLLALAHEAQGGHVADFPRRLIYIVNRRTVVDQATREAEHLRSALLMRPDLQPIAESLRDLAVQVDQEPLAISTLRGQFADNAEWRSDPARAAIIVGTVDMIGSRLLFSGYGCGFKSKPLHAGFLGQDALLVHDEAHLEPAFQELICAIQSEQRRLPDFRPLRVMALSATAREENEGAFALTPEDSTHPEVKKRLEARKGISFYAVDDAAKLPDKVADLALRCGEGGSKVLVFLLRVEHVERVAERLSKAGQTVQVLTGTLRGLERDALVREDPVFARFTPKPKVPPCSGTVYLICTSAGEVGVDLSADHLVCDLTPYDSMAQRLGRVNRFGEGDARIDVVYVDSSTAEKTKDRTPFQDACEQTLSLLKSLPLRPDGRHGASPADLERLPADQRRAAFTPPPTIPPVTDILFDAWAMTSVRQGLPGRPPVAAWLHGLAEWEPPETQVAWRDEVERVVGGMLQLESPGDLLEDYPLKSHELLRDRTDRVLRHLAAIADRTPQLVVWLASPDGEVRPVALGELVDLAKRKPAVIDLANCTVLLPPRAGGLRGGFLHGAAPFEEGRPYDVADEWKDEEGRPRRRRVWDGEPVPAGMRLVRVVRVPEETGPDEGDEEGEAGSRPWLWFARPATADDDGSLNAKERQDLGAHLDAAATFASRVAEKLALPDAEARAVEVAARMHDMGKNRKVWQRAIGNGAYPATVLAKSSGRMACAELSRYRHELGSLLDLCNRKEFSESSPEVQDLVQHLVATHHGRARPHFPAEEAFDPDHPDAEAIAATREAPRRFARLQRKYGRWGLAYLESLVRAADALASQVPGVGSNMAANAVDSPAKEVTR